MTRRTPRSARTLATYITAKHIVNREDHSINPFARSRERLPATTCFVAARASNESVDQRAITRRRVVASDMMQSCVLCSGWCSRSRVPSLSMGVLFRRISTRCPRDRAGIAGPTEAWSPGIPERAARPATPAVRRRPAAQRKAERPALRAAEPSGLAVRRPRSTAAPRAATIAARTETRRTRTAAARARLAETRPTAPSTWTARAACAAMAPAARRAVPTRC